jgi:hypothetical protein
VVPASAAPVSREQVTAWVLETRPDSHLLHRFKWLFRDDKSSAGGRGSARIAPPDSMRFDVAGPFGAEPAAAAVVGDRPLWAQPPDAIEKMVPNYPLMWGMFGVARLPEPGAGKLVGRAEATLDSTGAPVKSRLTVPSVPAQLDLTFSSTSRADFAPDIWVSRKP